MFDIPIALSIHTRPHILVDQINILKSINPKKVFLIIDPPNKTDLDFLKKEIYFKKSLTLIEESNLPIEILLKNNENKGSFCSFFDAAKILIYNEESFIILENDSMPSVSYFDFVKCILSLYRDDKNFLFISGASYQPPLYNKNYFFKSKFSYPMVAPAVLSKNIYDGFIEFNKHVDELKNNINLYNNFIKKRIEYFINNYNNKNLLSVDLDTYALLYSLKENKFSIFPYVNLVENCGFDLLSRNKNFNNALKNKNLFFKKTDKIPESLNEPLDQQKILKTYLKYSRIK